MKDLELEKEPCSDAADWATKLSVRGRELWPSLTVDNNHVWTRQPHCQICFKQTNGVNSCLKCCGAACCDSPECKEAFATAHSTEICELHCLRLASFVMAMQQGSWVKMPCRSRCDPAVSFPSGWAEYFSLKKDDFECPIQLIQLPPVTAQLTDGLSSILTAISALRHLELHTPSVPTKRFVVSVHFIGAEMSDMFGLDQALEEFLHWLPRVCVLDVALVGPELPIAPDESGVRQRVCMGMCEGCVGSGCEVYLTCVRSTYHDAMSEGTISKPTLAVCINSGLHEQPILAAAWAPTVSMLAAEHIPTVFTAYTLEEMENDYKQVVQVAGGGGGEGAEKMFAALPSRNPFRGLLPMPDLSSDTEFFYNSNYYMILNN